MCLATCTKLKQLLSDPQQLALLKIELAAVIDIGTYFVKGTYNLEGDGALATRCYEEVLTIRAAIASRYYPNVEAVANSLFPTSPVNANALIQYGISCVQPGIRYFEERYSSDSDFPVNVFKGARFFSPFKVHDLQPVAGDVDLLGAIPFLSGDISSLKEELPNYVAKSASVDPSVDISAWWKGNSPELPHWSSAAQRVFLIQPSSAAAEQVFSILNNTFSSSQMNSLEDYVEATVMLQYNQ